MTRMIEPHDCATHPDVDVRYNDFTGLYEVHGRKVTYWMFDYAAHRRATEIQAIFDQEKKPRAR